jgi:hypothetical protein
MDEKNAEQLRKQFMWDYDEDPDKLTNTLEELRVLQAAFDDPEELVNRYRRASAELLDFFDRLSELAFSEAEGNGGTVDFSNSAISQIILACIRGYPDYVRAFEGTNILLNDELETSRRLGRQVFEVSEHYEGIINARESDE